MRHALLGLANALVPGLGYLVLKERVVFGWCILLASIMFLIVAMTDPSQAFSTFNLATTQTGILLENLAYFLLAAGFGYDAYSLSKDAEVPTATEPAIS